MSFLRNKRGVSPLIATVLLIAFAVALGAVVMNWGRGYVEDMQDNAKTSSDTAVICTSDIHPEIVQIDKVDQICMNESDPSGTENTVYVIIQNSPRRDIVRFEAMIIGTASKEPLIINLGNSSYLPNAQAKLYNITYDETTYGNVSQITLTPVMSYAGEDIKCKSNALKEINLRSCSEIWD
ncbi:MAG: hypothetical protein KJ574_02245 [Nanoarchaeota archaeon]|nr:hypothetical protein [Nanoarchaeota archaeon]